MVCSVRVLGMVQLQGGWTIGLETAAQAQDNGATARTVRCVLMWVCGLCCACAWLDRRLHPRQRNGECGDRGASAVCCPCAPLLSSSSLFSHCLLSTCCLRVLSLCRVARASMVSRTRPSKWRCLCEHLLFAWCARVSFSLRCDVTFFRASQERSSPMRTSV